MLDSVLFFGLALWTFMVAAFSSLFSGIFSKKWSAVISGGLGMLAALFGIIGSTSALIRQEHLLLQIPFFKIPLASSLLHIDPLAAFFILLVCIAVFPVSLFSIGYIRAEYGDKPLGVLGALYHLFILSMLVVIMAGNGLLFLISWESMALLSFGLVVFDAENSASQKAGFLYLLMTHIGTAFILVLFFLLAQQSGSFEFSAYHLVSGHLPESLKLVLFACILIGFGTKAGIVPLHIWLPEAHPTAPSHVSALMSGVMIKTAVYGILRCVFNFLTPFPYGWGVALAVIAILTALLGIVYATVENDLKRLLAYSSIENMGIILLPLGVGMIFHALGYPFLATFALTAGLLHALNHAVFKSLLFLSAGSILATTHTRSLENMGGLIRRMPKTALFFLTGALAIAAFPPFNGFTGEWMIYQSLLSSLPLHGDFLRILLTLCAVLLGLVGALAAATFVKAFSTAFLALPRSHHATHARESSPSMQYGMGILALACLVLGVIPTILLPLLSRVSQSLVHNAQPLNLASQTTIQATPVADITLTPALVFMCLLIGLPLALWLPRLLGGQTAIRKTETWTCGVTLAPEFEYTPTGFSQPLQVAFGKLHRTANAYYHSLYLPVANGLIKTAQRAKAIQMGTLPVYLTYILVTLILCLVSIR